MKRVLITGANSYVGTNVEKWLMKEPENFYVETLDMRDSNWKNFDFSKFDVVFHVAGIAHIKETKKNKQSYFSVNRDLAIQVANISKKSQVKHFIFMSTMSVFGIVEGKILENTIPKPSSNYGLSKYEAELYLIDMINEDFNVSIVRPPMIYGPKCKGNYAKLSKFAKKFPVYPEIHNKRSAIFIDNFSNFIKITINNCLIGYLHPQNAQMIDTTELIVMIRKTQNLNTYNFRFLNGIIRGLLLRLKPFRKIYGTLFYDIHIPHKYCVIDFESSIKLTENLERK